MKSPVQRGFYSGFWHAMASVFIVIGLLSSGGCRTAPPPTPYKAPEGASAESGRPWVYLSASEMAEAVRNGAVTSQALVQAHLNQIHRYNPDLNAIVTIDEAAVLEQAREADEALKRGEIRGPLHGVPVTIKDHFAVKGLRTTNGFPPLADQITDFDATLVKRLKDAGAIILGKTNMPILAMDVQTHNPIFGQTNNPWNLTLSPGGSTGGGAAAVAAGMSPIEIGSDLGGSIRIPAHFCGLFGIKPTENTVSSYGTFPGLAGKGPRSVRHMVTIGPLARSIADLKLSLSIIAGPDANDPLTTPLLPVDPALQQRKDLKIAWSDNFGDVPITADTRRVLDTLVKKLAAQGFKVEQEQPAFDFNEVWTTWGEMVDIEIGILNPGFVRFIMYTLGGPHRSQAPLMQMVFPVSDDDRIKILSRRDGFVGEMDRFLNDWDVFISPVVTRPAAPHQPPDDTVFYQGLYDKRVAVDDQELNYWMAYSAYTTPFNLTGHPVVVIPAGFSSDGLPIGIQIVGKRWRDFELLDIAERINQVAGAYRGPEGY